MSTAVGGGAVLAVYRLMLRLQATRARLTEVVPLDDDLDSVFRYLVNRR